MQPHGREEEFKYLGVWFSIAGNGKGTEREWDRAVQEYCDMVKKRALSLSEARVQHRYMLARLQYSMQVADASTEWLDSTEKKLRAAHFLCVGMHRNSARALPYASEAVGGMGFERVHEAYAVARSRISQ